MNETAPRTFWRPSATTLIAGSLIVVFIGPLIASGIVLLTVRQNTPDDGS